MKKIGRVKYIGPDIGCDGLFNNGVYDVIINPEYEDSEGVFRIIDESEEDYLYDPMEPQSAFGKYKGGKFEVIEDLTVNQSIVKAVKGIFEKPILAD